MKTLLIIILAIGLAAVTLTAKPSNAPIAGTTWEYKVEQKCFDEGRINALGAQSWELAGFAENNTGGWHCVFKRPKS